LSIRSPKISFCSASPLANRVSGVVALRIAPGVGAAGGEAAGLARRVATGE
jgi:hypothetical protein